MTLHTSGPVTISSGGNVSIALTDGSTATYNAAASTSTSLVFDATMSFGGSLFIGVKSATLSGGATVTDASGKDVNLVPYILTANGHLDVQTPAIGGNVNVQPTIGSIPDILPLTPGFIVCDQPGLGTPGTEFSDQQKLYVNGDGQAGNTVVITDYYNHSSSIVGTVTAVGDAGQPGLWSLPLLALGDGVHNFVATASDSTGKMSTPSAPLSITIDPAALSVDGGSMQAGTYTADAGKHFAIVNAGSASFHGNAAASSSMTVYGYGGTTNFANGGGTGLVVGSGSASLNMIGGTLGSSLLAFTGTGVTSYQGGTGGDEIISGGGAMSLTGGTGGNLLVFGGAGTLNLMAGAESDMIIGGAGAETIHAGLGAAFGGTGGSMMSANGAGTFLAGNVSGDQMSASTVGGDIMAAGAGNETLNGAGSTGSDLMFAGTGSNLVSLGHGADTFAGGMGSDTVLAGSGNATLYMGSGAASLVVFTAGATGGTDTVSGFRVGTDHLSLRGYTGTASISTAGGSSTLGLSDGTKIVLQGVSTSTTTGLLG